MAQRKTTKNTKVKYTAKQKQDYHNKLAKPGAKKNVYDKSVGMVVTKSVSDFERGVHKAKADNICKARQKTWRKHNKNK